MDIRIATQEEYTQLVRVTLQSKGFEVTNYEYGGGHDASSLEYPLAKGLREIFG